MDIPQKKVIGYTETLDEEGKSKTPKVYSVQFNDGTVQEEVPFDDVLLTEQLEPRKFFVREVKVAGHAENNSYFELSPTDSALGINKIIVEVPKTTSKGEPDPRYEHILKGVADQKHDFMRMSLARSLVNTKDGSDIYRVLSFAEPSEKNYSVYFDEDTKSLKQTDSKLKREFTYTDNLQKSSDIYGQWRIAESHMNTLQGLTNDKDRFQIFITQTKNSILRQKENDLYTLEKEKQGFGELDADGENAIRLQVKQQPDYKNLKNYLSDPSNFPDNMEVLLAGNEVESENGVATPKNIIYDLDLPLKAQFTPTTNLDETDAEVSTYSQLVNYSLQTHLRQRMIDDSVLARVFTLANAKLVEDGIIPIKDPYRETKEMETLNQEYSEMIGSNIIAATMQHMDAKPNQFMKGFNPGEAIDRLLNGVNYDENMQQLGLNDFLTTVHNNVSEVTITHKDNLAELAETEAYEPGKSPRAIKQQKLQKLDSDLEKAALTGATALMGLEDAMNVSADIFR